jgi:integrase
MFYRTDIDRAAIIAARAEGMPFRKIVAKFGVPYMTVQKICRSGKTRLIDFAMVKARALETLILTGTLRTGETLEIQWSEIDWDQKLLIIPRERMKVKEGRDGAPHIVPLTNRLLEIFREMEAIRCGDYVFPGSFQGRSPKARNRFAAEHPGVTGLPLV